MRERATGKKMWRKKKMFVKQIDLKTALELAARGREVMMLTPTTTEPKKWTDYEPDTLQHMLDGCLFFRKEPALEKKLLVPPPLPEKMILKGPVAAKRSRSIQGSCWPFIRPDGAMSKSLTSWGSVT